MDRIHIEQTVLTVLAAVLKRPFHDSVEITRQNTASWDSLKHIEIMFALEDELGAEFSEEELVMLDSVPKIVDAVLAKHAA
jgi:acyl carrier protein